MHFKDIPNRSRIIDKKSPIRAIDQITVVEWTAPAIGESAKAIKTVKNNKASGILSVTAECIKDKPLVAEILHKHRVICRKMIKTMMEIPVRRLESVLMDLYKSKGDFNMLDNWRRIVSIELMSNAVSLFLNVTLHDTGEQLWTRSITASAIISEQWTAPLSWGDPLKSSKAHSQLRITRAMRFTFSLSSCRKYPTPPIGLSTSKCYIAVALGYRFSMSTVVRQGCCSASTP